MRYHNVMASLGINMFTDLIPRVLHALRRSVSKHVTYTVRITP